MVLVEQVSHLLLGVKGVGIGTHQAGGSAALLELAQVQGAIDTGQRFTALGPAFGMGVDPGPGGLLTPQEIAYLAAASRVGQHLLRGRNHVVAGVVAADVRQQLAIHLAGGLQRADAARGDGIHMTIAKRGERVLHGQRHRRHVGQGQAVLMQQVQHEIVRVGSPHVADGLAFEVLDCTNATVLFHHQAGVVLVALVDRHQRNRHLGNRGENRWDLAHECIVQVTTAQRFQHQVAAADIHPFHRVWRVRLTGVGEKRGRRAFVAPHTQRFDSLGLTPQQGTGRKNAAGPQQLPTREGMHGRASVEQVGFFGADLIPQRQEVEPGEKLVPRLVEPLLPGIRRRNQRRPGRMRQQVHTGGIFGEDKTPRGAFHGLTGDPQAVVLPHQQVVLTEGLDKGLADDVAILLQRPAGGAQGVAREDHLVPQKRAGLGGDRVEQAAQRRPDPAMKTVEMSDAHHLRARLLQVVVQLQGAGVQQSLALHHLALAIDPQQVGDRDLRERHAQRVDPVMLRVHRVTGGEVARYTHFETQAPEQTIGRGEALFAVQAFLQGIVVPGHGAQGQAVVVVGQGVDGLRE
nr:MAG TPA: hypothetical protein [Caudoviricetes sp.]